MWCLCRFVGLEMVEAFKKRGLETAVVEMMPHVMGLMDKAFGLRVGQELEAHGVKVSTGRAWQPRSSNTSACSEATVGTPRGSQTPKL